jgi:membrane protease YdiL (CAAX protease family)
MKRIVITILKVLGFFALWTVLISITPAIPAVDTPAFLGDSGALKRLWWELLPLLSVLIATFVFAGLIDKRQVKIRIFGSPVKNTLLGLCLGAIWLGVPIVVLYFGGIVSFAGKNSVTGITIWFIAALLNVIMQEYLVRGYLFQMLKERANVFVAVLVTTALFTAMHGGAFSAGIVAVLNVVTMSVFVSLLLLYTGTLLAPIVVHFIWNSVGCLIFGVVSLADDYPSILNSSFSGTSLLSGGIAKIEGSLVVLIVNLVLILLLVLLYKKKKQKA